MELRVPASLIVELAADCSTNSSVPTALFRAERSGVSSVMIRAVARRR